MLRDIDTPEPKMLSKSTMFYARGALQALERDDSYTYHGLYDAFGLFIADLSAMIDYRVYSKPAVALPEDFFIAWRFLFPTYQTLPAPYQCWRGDLKNYLLIKHALK